MRAGGGFEAGTAIGKDISSGRVGLAMKTTAVGFCTTLGVATGIGGRNAPTQQADRDHQSQYFGRCSS